MGETTGCEPGVGPSGGAFASRGHAYVPPSTQMQGSVLLVKFMSLQCLGQSGNNGAGLWNSVLALGWDEISPLAWRVNGHILRTKEVGRF